MTILEPLGLIFQSCNWKLMSNLFVHFRKWPHKTPISKHLINLDGHGLSKNFKAQYLGRGDIGIIKKNWWLSFTCMSYRDTKTINPSGLFEKFT